MAEHTITSNFSIEASWQQRLGDCLGTASMIALGEFLHRERGDGKRIYPPENKIFTAFTLTPFAKVKVVILGQDPYHGPGQAHGLSFSVEPDVTVPRSLKNIFTEMQSDLNIAPPSHGNLAGWAKQGVLLLNDCLSVEDGQPGSHQMKGWEAFTDAVMAALNSEREHLVFILWGRKAQRKGRLIDPAKHLVITSPHPSPLSAHHGFFGSKPFSQTNEYLRRHDITPIEWHLSNGA